MQSADLTGLLTAPARLFGPPACRAPGRPRTRKEDERTSPAREDRGTGRVAEIAPSNALAGCPSPPLPRIPTMRSDVVGMPPEPSRCARTQKPRPHSAVSMGRARQWSPANAGGRGDPPTKRDDTSRFRGARTAQKAVTRRFFFWAPNGLCMPIGFPMPFASVPPVRCSRRAAGRALSDPGVRPRRCTGHLPRRCPLCIEYSPGSPGAQPECAENVRNT